MGCLFTKKRGTFKNDCIGNDLNVGNLLDVFSHGQLGCVTNIRPEAQYLRTSPVNLRCKIGQYQDQKARGSNKPRNT